MNRETTEFEFRKYLELLPIATLRIVGRQCGVAKASAYNKDILIREILDVVTGKKLPSPGTRRGAPVKQAFLDPGVADKIDGFKSALGRPAEEPDPPKFGVASPEQPFTHSRYEGILEITAGGYGFLRAKNCQPSRNGVDVFVPAPVITKHRLRVGDRVVCTADSRTGNGAPAISEVLTVNDAFIGEYEHRPSFDSLTAEYPKEKILLSEGNGDLALRILDLFVPLGKGQRALIIAPPKAGKTTLLKSIARAVAQNYPKMAQIILLVGERPEEVTDIRETIPTAMVLYSTFDEIANHHVRVAELALEHAKRLVEQGRDVLILLDSITKLTRAYNSLTENTGKTLTGGLDAGALSGPKHFFGAARKAIGAGSITILATALVDTGSRMDDVIYEEFKGTGNSDIFLSRDLAERRIYPAIDIRRSGTRKEELLQTKDELAAIFKLRERGIADNTAGIIDMLKRTKSNEEFVARLPEWLRFYKNV